MRIIFMLRDLTFNSNKENELSAMRKLTDVTGTFTSDAVARLFLLLHRPF